MIACAMAGLMIIGCLAGCGSANSNKEGHSSTDVQISYWNAGLGDEWLNKLIEAFNEKNPEYNVYYNATASSASALAAFGLADSDTVDLYMTPRTYDKTYLESLNDVLDTTIEGESKSIREKFDSSYLELEKWEDNYYTLTYGGGMIGFVYNKELFEKVGITQLPRTTDELILVCATLADADVTPICHFKPSGYYHWINEVWSAQYDGIDYYRDFYNNPTKEKFTTKDGRYEFLKVHQKLNTPEYVLQGSNSESHVSMQTRFLEGEAAIMLNGSWLSSEMANSEKMGMFDMMKTPVISSITDKLTSVKSEKDLRKLIEAIDNVTDGIETIDAYKDGENYKVNGLSVLKEDWDYVESARNMTSQNYSSESCFIPTYSNAKEGAKEFLKFFYSDEGYKIYLEALKVKMPLTLSEGEIDTSNWNKFNINQMKMMEKAGDIVTYDMMSKDRLFTDGGANNIAHYEYISLMCSNNAADRVNADEAWNIIVDTINDRYDNEWLKNIK